ncbi:class I SAM-dependent methyltransferase [Alphaproteobacteria bacterium]|nr:class I SAM-dependent methyltransferase [Alphaproteobacteria bacterium]
MMDQQGKHSMLPENNHDEATRQMFVSDLKLHLARNVSPSLKTSYNSSVKHSIYKKHKRAPKNRHEVRKAMKSDPTYQVWSSLQRTSQEMKQDTQSEIAVRQIEELSKKAKIINKNAKKSTMKLNPQIKIPRYMSAVDIHCIPGGYHNELIKDDVLPGAVYDPGVFLYSMGRMGPYNEDIGATIISYIKEKKLLKNPTKILDMGCSVGHSTTPYIDTFPNSEVYGIDISGPFIRYAHARAESMDKKIHYLQQNAEKTDFKSESFDLIVSHILLHETSHPGLKNIFKECFRLLKKGGIMIHAETPEFEGMEPYDQFILDWDTYNNNEPFWGPLKELNLKNVAADSGFKKNNFFSLIQPSAIETKRTKGRTKLFQGGDFGGAGAWFLVGAVKL